MRNWTHALTLLLALGAAFPAVATPMTGNDGPLAPAADYTLPFRADGLFDFTTIAIGAGVRLRFDAQMADVTLRSLGDILIAGAVDAAGINLVFETAAGRIVMTGSILADSISLTANSMLPGGSLAVSPGAILCLVCGPRLSPAGRLSSQSGTALLQAGGELVLGASGVRPLSFPPGTVQLRPGGDIRLSAPGSPIYTVAEPATPWLVISLLPMLVGMGRTRI